LRVVHNESFDNQNTRADVKGWIAKENADHASEIKKFERNFGKPVSTIKPIERNKIV
jgi:hypothetical protein